MFKARLDKFWNATKTRAHQEMNWGTIGHLKVSTSGGQRSVTYHHILHDYLFTTEVRHTCTS